MNRMKRSMRPRFRWNDEQWVANVNHCCLFVWVLNQCKNDTHIEDNVLDGMTSAFLAGCFGQIK